MKAVVLAAGQGTRIRPLSDSVPKPMLPVADRPLVAHTIDAAVDAGADEIVLVIGYEADTVRDYFGAEYRGVPVSYAVQTEQAGTAHAVNTAREHIEGPFAVLNGDNLYDPAAIDRLFTECPAICAIEVAEPRNYGVLSTEGDSVTGIVEKPADPPTNLANAGAYAFPEEAKKWLEVPESERGEHEITDVVARVIDEFDVTPVTLERWLDVGRPWELLEANEWKIGDLERRIDGDVSEDAHLQGDVVVEDGATVKPGVVVEGPALIRSGATVGPNAYVRGATLIDEGAKVGHAAEVKNSVLSRDASVSHLSYVGDSILGRDVNFGAGTNVANLRHDDGDIEFTVKGERVSTGRRKFGVVAGDGAKTGINSSLSPGLKLDTGATTLPGETVDRDR
ncbi:bifunctional sugar-1-phosphate nucleotidylyltransferase/acetyltransferase [Natronorubrum texcoconense]|uniref:Bifunctional protein GlmU n=1 Tax=Natronorubrum texcoconense TaxID=1095776 RepID=A0A1G8X5L9_9EURY|nr:bifunctional sugar-1-phosphate nucleotidylyltransferase/acetyltransferase [Natronorubrum texcoconense]SDJ85667.1 bifunctional UDP-N-acetylglucosamine pyrophosphorylase / Glucosamine-1-phosphate N-acetyltransferase [Natronorubrum texcoconense]